MKVALFDSGLERTQYSKELVTLKVEATLTWLFRGCSVSDEKCFLWVHLWEIFVFSFN